MLKIMAAPSEQLFVIKSDKLEEFLAITLDREADETARKRLEYFKKTCYKGYEVVEKD